MKEDLSTNLLVTNEAQNFGFTEIHSPIPDDKELDCQLPLKSTVDTHVITHKNCQQIVTVLLQDMKDVPNVAEQACNVLYFCSRFEVVVVSASPLSPFSQDTIQALLTVTHRVDAGESRLRTATYETLNEVVRCSTEETAPTIMQLVPAIMMELHKILEAQKLSCDEGEKQNEVHGLLCGCLQVIITKLGPVESTKYVFLQYADLVLESLCL